MNGSHRFGLLAGAVLIALGTCFTAEAGGRPDLVLKALGNGRAHADGELLVQYRDGASASNSAIGTASAALRRSPYVRFKDMALLACRHHR